MVHAVFDHNCAASGEGKVAITNAFLFKGLHAITDSSQVTTAHGVYIENEDSNYFSGKVGIGTDTPAVNLHVSHATDPKIRVQDTTANYSSTLAGYSGGAYLAMGDMDSSESSFLLLGAFNSINNLNTKSRDFHLYGTNTTTGLYFDESAGRFGIGTTSPEGELHVAGSIIVDYAIAHGGDTNNQIVFTTDTQSFNTDGTTRMTIASDGAVSVAGAFSAATKSFDIEHPTKEGMRLHHGSLEGPEHGVYVRGRLEGNQIDLPDYWLGLVDEDTITVQLTPNRGFQQIYVQDISDNKVHVASHDGKPIDCFYLIQGERKDIERFEVEY